MRELSDLGTGEGQGTAENGRMPTADAVRDGDSSPESVERALDDLGQFEERGGEEEAFEEVDEGELDPVVRLQRASIALSRRLPWFLGRQVVLTRDEAEAVFEGLERFGRRTFRRLFARA